MVRHMFSNLLLLWSLSHEIYATGLTYGDPKEQSWNNHNLSSVPLDLDVRLRKLDLSNNFIRQLHTLGLPYLEQLDLSCNQLDLISEGAFENLAQLEELNLSRNALNNNLGSNSKALQSISRLRSLDISMNGLSDNAVELYLRNKPSLDQLKMTGNALTSLTHNFFKESESLRVITIDDNLISAIDQGTFEPLTHLETLNLAKNNLAHICDFKLHQVKYLNLSRNSVEFFVTHEDNQLYRLEILDLSYNKLLYFPIVPKMNSLKYLHLQNNMVGALNAEATIVSEANFLYNEIVGQGDVRVQKNDLHANWRLMPLVHIDLSYNHFRSFPLETLSLLSSLETLNFSHNCVQNIIWNVRNDSESGYDRQLSFSSLKYLDLQSNGLVSISPLFLKTLTQLETLNLQDNSVQPCSPKDHLPSSQSAPQINHNTSCVVFDQLRTLKHLNLKDNNIKMLHTKSFQKTSLVSLNLAGNPHMVMHVDALAGVQESLQSLTISEMNMTSSDLSFPCMPALTQLNISNNNLDIMPSSLTCSPLTEIDIRNNAFVSLNQSLILALSAHLNMMHISGNYFNCCDSKWLTILNESQIELPDISQAECFTSVSNIMVTEYLNSSEMYCLFHTKTQEIHFVQMIIIVSIVTVIVTVFIIFTRKVCCSHRPGIV
ncbi:transforming growth factor beta activator LRRC32-like isoform X1 [Thunnus albacares]|uniref:transforming growth factor beta activator LRRC32-like n=1 Tax=Thunnus maccoyii TaxID=8240 RepID=UPI001C4B2577|nr:transforming growth factor beta activator LRRC32-like [Thunnus maccoyii]XP_044218734.1 transforming growth factor beta activator LRRC32-like isoform X1 [Thunnus albacares]